MYNNTLTDDRLKSIMDYDQETGIFTSKVSRSNIKIGDTIGSPNKGYLDASVDGVRYKMHRLAWLYVYGEYPSEYIDHINGNKTDNRICNLREATNQQNQYNVGLSTQNTSGYKGVYLHKPTGKWRARIRIDKKQKDLGSFSTPQEAYSAYAHMASIIQGDYMREPL